MFTARDRDISDKPARKARSQVHSAISDKFGGRTQTRDTESIEPFEAIVEKAAKKARGGSKKE